MKNSQDFKNHFYTQFPIHENAIWTKPETFFFMGSCFSTNISNKFKQHFIDAYSNPFGTIFSPDALAKSLQHIQNQTLPTITNFQNTYFALLFDTNFKHQNKEQLELKIKATLELAHTYLIQSNTIFITLGSSWVYRHLETNEFVGNCQKIPQNQFEKTLLSVEQIIENLNQIETSIKSINSHCNIVFTVSPVRHLRDGISENLISKSHLIVALQAFLSEHKNCMYFPSYEIFNDELRDHRFFESDLAHPNEMAIDYIFNRLIETFGHESFRNYLTKAAALQQIMNHKLKTTDPTQIENWHQSLELKKREFQKEYPTCKI